jgi:hypothetical protein
VVLRKRLIEADFIGLGNTLTGMEDLLGEITVVREKEKALALLVKTADRKWSQLPFRRGEEFHNGTVKAIRDGTDQTPRFVENKIEGLHRRHRTPVKGDDAARSNPIARRQGRPAVNANLAGQNYGLSLPPRSDAAPSQVAIKPLTLSR